MISASNIILILAQLYFMLINLTVERNYCHDPLTAGDTRFLMPESFDFATANNPLFLQRPDYLRKAACVSAYVFFPFYILIALTALTDSWARTRWPIMIFIGAKMYAIGFYHLMEFTNEDPAMVPQNLVPYFAAEGAYIVSIVAVSIKCANAASNLKEAVKSKEA